MTSATNSGRALRQAMPVHTDLDDDELPLPAGAASPHAAVRAWVING